MNGPQKYPARLRWVAVAMCALLAACLVPDRYKATLDLTAAGDYTLTYDGQLVDLVMLTAREKGQLSPKLEEEMVRLYSKELTKEARGLTLEYKGDARFEARLETAGSYRAGKMRMLADLLQIKLVQDGVLEVRGLRLKDLKKPPKGLTSTGDICITTDMPVIEHNADSTPGLFSRCYRWKNYDMIEGAPLLLRLKAEP